MPYVGQKPADIISTAVDTVTGKFSGEVDAASLDISGNIDVDGTTNLDVVDIDGAVDMAGTLGVTGVVTANAGVVVDNMTLDGNTLSVTSSDFIIDATHDIILDAAGNEIKFQDNGTLIGFITLDNTDITLKTSVSDRDIIFQGNDGGSTITALSLDMSSAGDAHFNQDIYVRNIYGNNDANTGIQWEGSDLLTFHAGGVEHISLSGNSIVFNQDSADMDFRVESDNDDSAFFVNGETGNTGFGTSTTPASISIYTNISSTNNFDGVRLRNVSTSSNQYGGALFVGLLSGGIPQAQVRGPADNNGMLIFQTGGSETEHFRIAGNGTLTATDTSIGSNSDSRLKKDIEDYTYDINNFKDFRTRTFEWINKEEHGNKTNCVGFVAQEVESTDARWVDENQINDTNGNGTTNADWNLIPENEKGIRKSKTSKLGEKDAMYISVIQQLITRIEALEKA